MGMLDSAMAKLGGDQGAEGRASQSLTKMLNANGGVQGLMTKLSSSGAGQQVQSWVGHGENKPVSGAQVQQALDTDSLSKMAQQAGTTPEKVSEHVAQVLPEVVDKATPQGEVPKQGDDPLSKGMDAIKGMFAQEVTPTRGRRAAPPAGPGSASGWRAGRAVAPACPPDTGTRGCRAARSRASRTAARRPPATAGRSGR